MILPRHLGRIWRTVKDLEPRQCAYQVLRRVQNRLPPPRVSLPDKLAPTCAFPVGLILPHPSGKNACLDPVSGLFSFIGLENKPTGRIPWSGSGLGTLWDYNLHYFEWIWGLPPEKAKVITLEWIAACPLGKGTTAWAPYPLSLRIQNLLGYWGTEGRGFWEADPDFQERVTRSIALQCGLLLKRLEFHLGGNHLLENAFALWISACFFKHPLSRLWAAKSKCLLREELHRQMLPDGFHYERSPMYHHRVIHLLDWGARLAGKQDFPEMETLFRNACKAGQDLLHPDGRIALLNDSSFGIYPDHPSENQTLGVFAYPNAGYYGSRHAEGHYLVCDAGPIGPKEIPGHAHCDVLSFEFSLFDHRFVTDTGVWNYLENDRRSRARSTAAHNVTHPSGVEQAEMWGAFRVGRKPQIQIREWSPHTGGGFRLEAMLPYHGKGKNCVCRRTVVFQPEQKALTLEDSIQNPGTRTWEGNLHFHPDVSVVSKTGRGVVLDLHGHRVELDITGATKIEQRQSEYFPSFHTVYTRLNLWYQTEVKSQSSIRILFRW